MTPDELRTAITQALTPERFFASGGKLSWRHEAAERTAWEIFRGHLLDRRQTRAEEVFETWDILWQPSESESPERLISLRLSAGFDRIYITRELLVYGEEAYESAPNVIDTRPARIRATELVGSVAVECFTSVDALAVELSHYVLLALVGTSRLPITSVESPLPVFSLGQVGYLPKFNPSFIKNQGPVEDISRWFRQGLMTADSPLDSARVLDFALRAVERQEVLQLAVIWKESTQNILPVVRTLFNHVALTPYTSLVDHLVMFLRELSSRGVLTSDELIDLWSYLLRHLVRHLTAFDLVTFHNQGANYPDALMLDTILHEYIADIEHWPAAFHPLATDCSDMLKTKRLRRRALRQAWLIRRQYVDHAVPDAPTSPGENQRVLPSSIGRVPDEQLTHLAMRRKLLFQDSKEVLPTGEAGLVFCESVADLQHVDELRELGMAVFLDRPLGIFHPSGAVDRTSLVSYETFSQQIAVRRLELLRSDEHLNAEQQGRLAESLKQNSPPGLPINTMPNRGTAGVVALEDALHAAPDFVLLRTTRQSLDGLLTPYDLAPLAAIDPSAAHWLATSRQVLLIRTADRITAEQGGEFLTAFDYSLQSRIGFALAPSEAYGYHESHGVETPLRGLRIVRLDNSPMDVLLH